MRRKMVSGVAVVLVLTCAALFAVPAEVEAESCFGIMETGDGSSVRLCFSAALGYESGQLHEAPSPASSSGLPPVFRRTSSAEGADDWLAHPDASFICGCEASVSSCPECQFCCADVAQCSARWCRRIPIWWTCSEWVERNLLMCLVNCVTDWNCQ